MNKQQMYFNYLRQEGFMPQIDKDNDIVFKYQGKMYVIINNDNDPDYFRLVLPSFWEIENSDEMTRALKSANEVNSSVKIGSIVIVKNYVWATAEVLMDNQNSLASFFPRLLSVVTNAAESFGKEMIEKTTFDSLLHSLIMN